MKGLTNKLSRPPQAIRWNDGLDPTLEKKQPCTQNEQYKAGRNQTPAEMPAYLLKSATPAGEAQHASQHPAESRLKW